MTKPLPKPSPRTKVKMKPPPTKGAAGATFVHFPGGKEPKETTPGDIVLVRKVRVSAVSELIEQGERIRHGHAEFTHSALVTGQHGDIVEANSPGVQQSKLSKYRDEDYVIVSPSTTKTQRSLAVKFAQSQVGTEYGVLDFVCLAVQCLFDWNISLHEEGQNICSQLVARATEKYIVKYPREAPSMMPDDIAWYYRVTSVFPEPEYRFLGKFLAGVKGALSVVFGSGDTISG